MRIVLFSTRFGNGLGGVEKVLELLVDRIKGEKIVITSISDKKITIPKLLHLPFYLDYSYNSSYSLYKVWMGTPTGILGMIIFPYRFLFSIFALCRIFLKSRAEIVNYHFPDDSMIYFWILKMLFKFRYVLNIHGNDLHVFSIKPHYKWLFKWILNKSSKIIVNSNYMKNDLITSHPECESKVHIIPNGIELKYISDIVPGKKLNRPYIFYVGRLVHKKGVDILLDAFVRLGHNDLNLIIEGSGQESEKLKNYCTQNNIINVTFTDGKFSQEEKFSMMKNAVFGVVPSRIEPFGIVSLEYMACGTPVIVSDTGGLSELVTENYNGLKFINGSVDDLKTKMQRLINDEALRHRISENSLEYVKQYDLSSIVQQYEKVFSDVHK